MTGSAAELVAVCVLVLALVVAVARPFGVSEALIAVPGAALLVAIGVEPGSEAVDRLKAIGPTVGFLAAILVFGHLCAEAGVFDYLGGLAARGSLGQPRRLLGMVVVLAAAITAVLTLDATVVLLTPVVLRTVSSLSIPARPHAYATVRLANSGSLLLPVSNLTNLLVFSASGLSFGRFAALMTLPWIVACAGEWCSARMWFRADLPLIEPKHLTLALRPPRYALTVLALTVSGFVLTSAVHVAPAWAALGGCVLLLVPKLRTHEVSPVRLIREASPGFCAFVLALAVIVEAVTRHGLGHALRHLVPSGASYPALLTMAFVAATLANVVNNLPATLGLLPLIAANPALVLAMLVGVNIGPNATYGGSLATLLWRRIVPANAKPRPLEFHAFGLLTTPLVLTAATTALWLSLRCVGL